MKNIDLTRVGVTPFVLCEESNIRTKNQSQESEDPKSQRDKDESKSKEAVSNGSSPFMSKIQSKSQGMRSAVCIPSVFEKSRTLKSITLSKDSLISSQNILKIPIEYDIQGLKRKTQDATKLFCAVRNFYE